MEGYTQSTPEISSQVAESSNGVSRASRNRKERSRLGRGCLPCQERKAKCDEAPGGCLECWNHGRTCQYPRPPPALTRTASPANRRSDPHRSARVIACEGCRTSKVRCSQHRPACKRCEKRCERCVYLGRSPSPAGVVVNLSQDEVLDPGILSNPGQLLSNRNLDRPPSRAEILKLVEAFFIHVYPTQANAIVRRADLLPNIQHGASITPLTLAICANAYRFTDSADSLHPDGGELPRQWAKHAMYGIMDTADDFSTESLTTILLLAIHESNSGRHHSVWLLVSMAVRMAYGMRLHTNTSEGPVKSWIEIEVRNRLMWAAYCADRFSGGGMGEYTLCSDQSITIPLPVSEDEFDRGQAQGDSRTLQEVVLLDRAQLNWSGQDNLMSRYVQIMFIRDKVLRCVKNLDGNSSKAWHSSSAFQECVGLIRHWRETLPSEFDLTIPNLRFWQRTNQLGSLLALHMWYDLLSCDLYRIAIPSISSPSASSYLNNAPEQWIKDVRFACFLRAHAIGRKFGLFCDNFPDIVLSDTHFLLFAHECIRTMVGYFAETRPGGVAEEDEYAETIESFQKILNVVSRSTRYYAIAKPMLVGLCDFLVKHGYSVSLPETQPGEREEVANQVLPDQHRAANSLLHLWSLDGVQGLDSGSGSSTSWNVLTATSQLDNAHISPFLSITGG